MENATLLIARPISSSPPMTLHKQVRWQVKTKQVYRSFPRCHSPLVLCALCLALGRERFVFVVVVSKLATLKV